MRALAFAALGLALAGATDAAANTVGVVVTGEAALQPPLVAQLEGWLRSHGHDVVARSLDPPAISTLVDCFTVDDGNCARMVVEKRSRADSVVFARAAREGSGISLTVHWLVKGKPPVGARRGCERCDERAMRGTADALMAGLVAAANISTGRLVLRSRPAGLIVMLDGAKIGVTPLERDLAVGAHAITLVAGGTRVGERQVEIVAGGRADVTVPVMYPVPAREGPPAAAPPSRLVPVLLFAGAAAAIGGGVELYLGTLGSEDDKWVYPGATTAGVALVATGAVALGTGLWLWRRGARARAPAPVAAIASGGGFVGWRGSF